MSRILRKSLLLLAGLGALVVTAATSQAAPMAMPQQMAPAFAPAVPGQGVAAFRPHFRPQAAIPRNGVGRYGMPQGRHAVQRAVAWPIPVSYRQPPRMPPRPYPMSAPPRHFAYWPAPFPRQQQFGYPRTASAYRAAPGPRLAYPDPRRMAPRAYPGPVPGVMPPGYRPMPWMAHRALPGAQPWDYRRGPRGGGFHAPPQRPLMPVRDWRPPVGMIPRSAMHPLYPGRQQWRRPPPPPPQAVAGRYAGRYQPYNTPLRGQPNYRFRPLPGPFIAQRAVQGLWPNPPARYQYPYNRWPGNQASGQVDPGPWAGRNVGRLPVARPGEALAWRPQMIQ